MAVYTKANQGYCYILTVIDIFSKYAWALPLKQKTGGVMVKAFTTIFGLGRKPIKLNTDQGTEFENKSLQAFFKERKCPLSFNEE